MNKLFNRVKMSVSGTPGTGTITLGSAVSSFTTFLGSGAVSGDVVSYVLEDGNAWEVGTGTYTASGIGATLSRDTVRLSSNGNSKINASSATKVICVEAKEDFADLYREATYGAPAYIETYGGGPTKTGAVNYAALVNALAANPHVAFASEGTYEIDFSSTISLGASYRVSASDHGTIIKNINVLNATMFNLTAEDAEIANITMDGNKAVTSSNYGLILSGNKCGLRNVILKNMPGNALGSVQITGTQNYVVGCRNYDAESSGLSCEITCTEPFIEDYICERGGGFGVRVYGGSKRGEIRNSRSYEGNQFEFIGLQVGSGNWRIFDVISRNCITDNGISVSSDDNLLVGIVCEGNYKAGIHVWGSRNVIVGARCSNNNLVGSDWSGVGISANYGGAGQDNVIVGGYLGDTTTPATSWNGIRFAGLGYTVWSTGAVVAAAQYRYYGLNIYYTAAGGTTGATAPTHTSGSASDGAVTWVYINSFRTAAQSSYNQAVGFQIGGFVSGAVADIPGTNTYISSTALAIRGDADHIIHGLTALYLGIAGNNRVRLTNTEFRPEADNNMYLGGSGNTRAWVRAYLKTDLYIAENKVLGPRRTGWGVPTGTATRTTFDTATVTTAQLAERVKALIDDLTTHGVIGA